jgi:hypothetical protein
VSITPEVVASDLFVSFQSDYRNNSCDGIETVSDARPNTDEALPSVPRLT